MTPLLEKAFAEASQLPDQEQDALARWLLDELASERHREEAFAGSAGQLGQLADEALAKHHRGRTQPLDAAKL